MDAEISVHPWPFKQDDCGYKKAFCAFIIGRLNECAGCLIWDSVQGCSGRNEDWHFGIKTNIKLNINTEKAQRVSRG